MQLTERQCWDVIRGLVTEKNKEYARFVSKNLGEKQIPVCAGYIKNIYLSKFHFNSEGEFRYLIKKRGVKPKDEWLDNLSGEDLLLFLDFCCRALQQMYDQVDQKGDIAITDVEYIISSCHRSRLVGYNYDRLVATGRPNKVGGELNVGELDFTEEQIKNMAFTQTMGNIAYRHSTRACRELDETIDLAFKLVTVNVHSRGKVTGHKFGGSKNGIMEYIQESYSVKSRKRNGKSGQSGIIVKGLDEHKMPVFMRDGIYINIFGDRIPPVKVVYDSEGNKLEEESWFEAELNAGNARYVGLDIQESPIYEIDGDYYSAVGQKLPDDVFIQRPEDIFGI